SRDGLGKSLVQKEMAQVDSMTHPLIRYAAGKLPVQTKLKVELRIKRPVRFSHKPKLPIRVLRPDLFHFRATAPSGPVIVPNDFVLRDITQRSSADKIARGNLIWLPHVCVRRC